MVFQNFHKEKLENENLKKFEITNPVIGCRQSTLKECRPYFQYVRFLMSCQKLEAPEVRYFCFLNRRQPTLCSNTSGSGAKKNRERLLFSKVDST